MSPPSHGVPQSGLNDSELLDALLKADPAGIYSMLDAPTRERYRQACRELAAWSGRSSDDVAREAIRLSEAQGPADPRGHHVGAQLIAEGRSALEARLGCRVPPAERARRRVRRWAPRLYAPAQLVLTALVLVAVERWLAARGIDGLHRALGVVSLALPVLDFFNELLDAGLGRALGDPPPLPKLDPERVFAPDTRTLVVTPLLVTRAEDIESQLRNMESNALGNVAPDLLFALLTDFRDAPEKELPEDGALLERLERGVRELNARHGHPTSPRFLWLHRERRWNPVAGRWMGWERKRGKLEEFNRLVLGARDTSYTGVIPDVVRTVRYVITLDADTRLLPGSAARLVATLHHPLNQARFAPGGQRVIAGYSLIQPHMASGPTRGAWLSSGGWRFSLVREPKPDPIGQSAWALMHAVYGSGDFLGKGLYDVAAFVRSLEGRLPENTILSHDKLEGAYARVGYATDITLLEDHPKGLLSYVRVWHRWVRGDWQVLPWLLPRVPTRDGRRVPNTLSLLERWRLLVDMRRSLTHPSLLLALVSGWLWLPEFKPWVWALGWTLWILRPAGLSIVNTVFQQRSLTAGLRTALMSLPRLGVTFVFKLVTLVPASAVMIDAILRALYRLAFDRRRMLDWTTHAQTNRHLGSASSLIALPEVRGALALALGLMGALAVLHPWALPWAAAPLIGWLPFAALARKEQPAPHTPGATPSDVERLRALARRSWALHERLDPSGAELPRGAFTEDGGSRGAAELSPTDLSLWLVASLSAYHLGYLGLEGLVDRLGRSLAAVARLERHRGHLFERYDAQTFRPLAPRRVRAAESGVWSAALLVLESGLRAARATPATPRALRQGLIDTLRVLEEEASTVTGAAQGTALLAALRASREVLTDSARNDAAALAELQRQRETWGAAPSSPEASGMAEWWARFDRQLVLFEHALRPEALSDPGLIARLEEVEARARALREEMDFALLYDGTVDLLRVGYDVDAQSSEAAHHGLLASGALLAGVMAIARRQVPLRHWIALVESDQRLRASAEKATAGQGLSEHLMPALFLWVPPATLLGQAALSAIDAELAQGAAHGVPWGVADGGSGAPPSGAAQPITLAPHLSVLSQRFRPVRASENLKRMVELGAVGRYGLFDALQVGAGAGAATVQRTFTFRNQGMTLAAVANLACDDILLQHFHQHWQTAWVEGLVYETKDVS